MEGRKKMKNIKSYLEKELAPIINEKVLILLTGSRALGFESKDSDYDCYLVVPESEHEAARKYFISKEWCNEHQGPWTNLKAPDGNQLTLILKHYGQFDNERDPERQFIFTNAKIVIGTKEAFKVIIEKLKKVTNHEYLLRKNYLELKLAMRMLESMYKRPDTKSVAIIKKGDVVRSFMKTVILIDRKLPPYEKWLSKLFLQSRNSKKAKTYISRIENIKSFEQASKMRENIFSYIDSIMPNLDYVGIKWWQYLP